MTMNLKPSRLFYVLRLTVFFVVTLAIVLPIIPIALGMISILTLTRSPCIVGRAPSAYGLAYEEVTFTVDAAERRAYFIPSASDATVILAPPVSQDHSGQMPYAIMFHELGLNVFMLGSRRCVNAASTFGYAEAEDVLAAYDTLQGRTDIHADHVSVHGFSAAGAAALFAAARQPKLRAVSAMGNYHDFAAIVGTPFDQDSLITSFYQWGVVQGYQWSTGVPIHRLKPIDVLADIDPRPILLVYGAQEPSLVGARLMLDAAKDHATLWVVPNVGHGGYLQQHPEQTRQRLGRFHVNPPH